MTFMRFLELSLVFALFVLPLLEHLSFNLLLELFKLLLSVLIDQLLPVGILILDRLLLAVDLLLLFFILFHEVLLKVPLRSLLLFFKLVSLLPHGLSDVLFHLALPIPDLLLVLPLEFILGVLQFVVVSVGLGFFPLTIPLKSHLHLFLNSLLVPSQLFLLLGLQRLDVAPVLRLKIDFVLLYLVAEQVLGEKFDLLLDITRLLQ